MISPFQSPFSSPFPQQGGAAAPAWWLTDGVSDDDTVLGYDPGNAEDTEDSLINLPHPGTHNAMLEYTTWNRAWIFEPANATRVATGVTTLAGGSWSVLCQFEDYDPTIYAALFGSYCIDPPGGSGFYLIPGYLPGLDMVYWSNSGEKSKAYVGVTHGVIGMSGRTLFINGIEIETAPVNPTVTIAPLYLGWFFGYGMHCRAKMKKFGLWNKILFPEQMFNLSANMAIT